MTSAEEIEWTRLKAHALQGRAHVTREGVIGAPRHASAVKRERVLEAASDPIAALITDGASWGPRSGPARKRRRRRAVPAVTAR